MRILMFLILLLQCLSLFTQNIEDAYKIWNISPEIWNDDHGGYTGEYQVFTDKLYWNQSVDLYQAAVSLSIEIVSFPFVPIGNDLTALQNSTYRILSTNVTEDGVYGELELKYNGVSYQNGIGWDYKGFKIFQKTYNCRECGIMGGTYECSGNYGLITEGYATNIQPYQGLYDENMYLPHTVLKHTLYYHCGPTISSVVIDSISWIYDNTRGQMNNYPFDNPTRGPILSGANAEIDVIFRPTFNHFTGEIPYPPEPIWTSNGSNGYYISGHPSNSGSVNYFPPEEIFNPEICNDYDLYYPSGNHGGYLISNHLSDIYDSDFVHPPSYALLDAPLLNYNGTRYAGYCLNSDQLGLLSLKSISVHSLIQI